MTAIIYDSDDNYDKLYTWIATRNGKVFRFALGDHYAGGIWDNEKDDFEKIDIQCFLFQAIRTLSIKKYLAFIKDVGKDFIDKLEKTVLDYYDNPHDIDY